MSDGFELEFRFAAQRTTKTIVVKNRYLPDLYAILDQWIAEYMVDPAVPPQARERIVARLQSKKVEIEEYHVCSPARRPPQEQDEKRTIIKGHGASAPAARCNSLFSGACTAGSANASQRQRHKELLDAKRAQEDAQFIEGRAALRLKQAYVDLTR